MRIPAALLLLFLYWPALLASEKPDSLRGRAFTVLPVPAFGYSPETGTYAGVVGLVSFRTGKDSLTRASVAKAEFNYTWKNQYITDLAWDVFTPGEKYSLKGRLSWSDYPDFYWGTGEIRPPDSRKTRYDSHRLSGEVNFLKGLSRNRFWGLILRYMDYAVTGGDSLEQYPELVSSAVSGAGIRLVTEKRNSLLTPTSGRYSDVSLSLNAPRKGNYLKLAVDLRYYHTIRQKHTLAGRFYGQFNTGVPPFYDQALLGGDSQVRGYYYGQYRSTNLGSLQAEFRSMVWRRWGYALFCGVSKVNDDLAYMNTRNLKPNYGAGLRFMIDRKERISLRVDYARGTGHSEGFYISFGEAF